MDVSALIFVPALAGCVVVGFPLALLASNAFLTVLQQTGAGAKKIEWPSESIPDHFWKVFYLAWLIGLWLGPAFFVGRWAGNESGSTFIAYAVPLAVIWLMYPVSQLSSLSGPTVWLPLWPDVFARLAQKQNVTLGFYGFSAATLLIFGLAYHWTFGNADPVLLFLGAPLLVISWMVYARLLGRLAFVLMFTKPWRKRKNVKPRKPRLTGHMPGEAEETKSDPEDRRRVHQPSEQEPLQTPDEGPVHGYDVKFQYDPPPVAASTSKAIPEPLPLVEDEEDPLREATERRRRTYDRSRRWDEEDDDATPYIAHAPEVAPEDRAPKQLMRVDPAEMRLLNRRESPREPKQAWSLDVLSFLSEPRSIGVVFWLSFLCLVVGGMLRIARSFNPATSSG